MDDVSEFDLGDGAAQAAPASLALLNEIADQTIELERAALQMEDDLKALKKTLQQMKTQRLPEMMATLGISECVREGWRIKISDFISGSLPSDPERRKKALDWLTAHDGESLIKTTVELSFGRSEHNLALSIAAGLREQGLSPDIDSGVHSATLQSFARQKLKDGSDIDTEVLGLFTGKVAKLTEVKK